MILPLALLKDMSSLRFASTLSVSSVLFVMFVMLVRSSQALSAGSTPPLMDLLFPPTVSLSNVLNSVPVITLSFACQFNVPPMYHELRAKSLKRMDGVVKVGAVQWVQ